MEPQGGRDIFDFLTAGAAVAGVVLGLVNLWFYFDQRRVKLRVSPKWSYPVGDQLFLQGLPEKMLGVEVINLSAFAVTITQAGLEIPWSSKRIVFINPVLIDGKPWPRRLDPRESVTVYSDPASIAMRPGRCYAWTACDTIRKGKRPHWQRGQDH
jgi:hypothetical protein